MIKINMGCGWRNFGEGWYHIDGGDYEHLDHKDIFKLPFKDESVDLIYASHVIEYFDREEVIDVLSEWIRVLKKGGILRVAVPNFKVLSKLYIEGIVNLNQIIGPLYGKMNMGDEKIYHKTTYDFDSLKSILKKIGLENIDFYDWRKTSHACFDDHSQAYIPHMSKHSGVLVSLNIEGYKK